MKNNKIIFINILQAFAILTVFLGHALRIYHSGGWYFHKGETVLICDIIDKFIYSFHMPLFVFLSGYLFFANFDKIKNLNEYILKRIKRLLLPFLTVGLFYVIPLICIVNPLDKDIVFYYKNFLNLKFCWHLWFLPMLFIVNSIFAILFINAKTINKFIILPILIILNLIQIQGPQSCIYTVPTYLIYFYLGCIFFEYRKFIQEKILKYTGAIALLMIALETCLYFNPSNSVLKLISATSMILLSYLISFKLSKYNFGSGFIISYLSKNLFILYLLHEPIMAFILKQLNWGKLYTPFINVNILFWATLTSCIIIAFIIQDLVPKLKRAIGLAHKN